MSTYVMIAGDFPPLNGRNPAITLRLVRTSLAVSPAAAKAARIGAGACVGILFGAACGNLVFWLVVGLALGWLLARLRGAG